MIRPIFTEIALFLTPFAVYALYLWATRAAILDPVTWSVRALASLTVISLTLMAASFLLIAHFSGSPPRSTYVPAHIENGRLVPGSDR